MACTVEPLNPDSAKGCEVTERLNEILTEIYVAITERKAAAQRTATADPQRKGRSAAPAKVSAA